jgi:hypothetical protein
MRGIEQAIWWRRISSVLGYEPISSPVRYGATEACLSPAIEFLFRKRGLDLQYDRIFSFAIGWRRRQGRCDRTGWLSLTGAARPLNNLAILSARSSAGEGSEGIDVTEVTIR